MTGSQTTRSALQAMQFILTGCVQGLGVRPAIYRLAKEHDLKGRVRNTAAGVEIQVEGSPANLDRFRNALPNALPAAAVSGSIRTEFAVPAGYTEFEIIAAESRDPLAVPIPVDRSVCSDCLSDVFDPASRRYRYPFTSCTNCGPRYTIIESMPYERAHTTLSRFGMCPACRTEYEDPADRRFHAQTIACPDCGPRIWSVDQNRQVTGRDQAAVEDVACCLREGGIVALRGMGGYQLLVDATNEAAVSRLRKRKRRRVKPLAVLVNSVETAEEIADIDSVSREQLRSPGNPIVLLLAKADSPIAASVHPGLSTIGLMLPTSALHALLLAETGRPLVCTSGNVEGEPLEYEIDAAESRLAEICDCWLQHDLPIAQPLDDSVVRVIGGRPVSIRLARGLAPLPLEIPRTSRLLAAGGYLKSSIAFSNGRQAVLGPHIGDQESVRVREKYVAALERAGRLYRVQMDAMVHDQHPEYFSTRYARECRFPACPVQHHHAHIVAGMVERGWLDREVLGMAWDGTGFGTDGAIWGGEFLLCTATSFQRVGSLRPFRLPGGEAAVREPWRVVVSLCNDLQALAGQNDLEWMLEQLRSDPRIGSRRLSSIQNISQSERLCPVTTSAGRLFDAAAAVVLGRHFSDFDGQPAIELEDAAGRAREAEDISCACEIAASWWKGPATEFDWRPLIAELIGRRMSGESPDILAYRFHAVLACGIARFCERFPDRDVVLGGGVFQNRILTEMIAELIPEDRLGRPGLIPPNDGGLAAGQLAVAACQFQSQTGD